MLERGFEAQHLSQGQMLCKMISALRGIEWRWRGCPKAVQKPLNIVKTCKNLQTPSKPYMPMAGQPRPRSASSGSASGGSSLSRYINKY
eukprot:14625713-Heterocapsa_arctica.AAC.1